MSESIDISPDAIRGIEDNKPLDVMRFGVGVSDDGNEIILGAPSGWWEHFVTTLQQSHNEELVYWGNAIDDAIRWKLELAPRETTE